MELFNRELTPFLAEKIFIGFVAIFDLFFTLIFSIKYSSEIVDKYMEYFEKMARDSGIPELTPEDMMKMHHDMQTGANFGMILGLAFSITMVVQTLREKYCFAVIYAILVCFNVISSACVPFTMFAEAYPFAGFMAVFYTVVAIVAIDYCRRLKINRTVPENDFKPTIYV